MSKPNKASYQAIKEILLQRIRDNVWPPGRAGAWRN